MNAWPRVHTATAAVTPEGWISVAGPEPAAVATSDSLARADASGWSPATLLVCAVAYSFIESLCAGCGAEPARWSGLEVAAHGTLDHLAGGPRFSRFDLAVTIDVADEAAGAGLATEAERAARRSLAVNTLAAPVHVDARVRVTPAPTGHAA